MRLEFNRLAEADIFDEFSNTTKVSVDSNSPTNSTVSYENFLITQPESRKPTPSGSVTSVA